MKLTLLPAPSVEELVQRKGATSIKWKWFDYKSSDVICKKCSMTVTTKGAIKLVQRLSVKNKKSQNWTATVNSTTENTYIHSGNTFYELYLYNPTPYKHT